MPTAPRRTPRRRTARSEPSAPKARRAELKATPPGPKGTKGERTAERILDAAERLFAERGYEAASLREIASAAGIRQPGLYNHFASKQRLYEAVLERALAPMLDAMQRHMQRGGSAALHVELPSVMTDILLEHPKMAALFQQALQGEEASLGTRLIREWLDRLFDQAMRTLKAYGPTGLRREDLAIHIIALFNATTGYFLSQRALAAMVDGDIADPANIERQKRLLDRMVRATLRP